MHACIVCFFDRTLAARFCPTTALLTTIMKSFCGLHSLSSSLSDPKQKLRNVHHESTMNNPENSLQERRSLSTDRSRSGTWDVVDGKVVILRHNFLEHYPRLLVEVTTNLDESMAKSMRDGGRASVDISFKDLSLAVQVAGKQINVVDHVTGRLQAKTMTALMGGSGCGTFFVECHGRQQNGKKTCRPGSIKTSTHLVPPPAATAANNMFVQVKHHC
jgi:hypothetical protein